MLFGYQFATHQRAGDQALSGVSVPVIGTGHTERSTLVVVPPTELERLAMRTRQIWLGAALFISLAAGAFLAASQNACADEKCLSDGENCSQSYLKNNDMEGYQCCNGQTCQEGIISGVLVCRY